MKTKYVHFGFCPVLAFFPTINHTSESLQHLWEQQKTEVTSPPPLQDFSAILTAQLVFRGLLCDIWLTEQRCHRRPSQEVEEEAMVVLVGGGIKRNKRREDQVK